MSSPLARTSLRRGGAVAAIALLITGCATALGPGDSGYPFNVRGAYSGRLMFEGQPFDAALSLRTLPGGRVTGSLRVVAPIRIDGSVEGRLIDDLLRITVRYRNDDGCDGEVEGILTVERGAAIIDGPVTVSDCGNPLSGRMSFRRGA